MLKPVGGHFQSYLGLGVYGHASATIKMKRVQTNTITIYTEAKINHKMPPNWP